VLRLFGQVIQLPVVFRGAAVVFTVASQQAEHIFLNCRDNISNLPQFIPPCHIFNGFSQVVDILTCPECLGPYSPHCHRERG